ncbi:MAG TPA: replicative DNA helicase [Ktedonobacteraceae bacterium]|jgi:replicative DNA helicase
MKERRFPQNNEAERGVLGSLLADPEAFSLVGDRLRPQDFYQDRHCVIYKALLALYERSQPADLLTLREELEVHGNLEAAGGAPYLTSLGNAAPTSGNVEYYARIVAQKAYFRHLIHTAGRIAALAYDEAEEAQEQAEQLLFALRRRALLDLLPIETVVQGCLEELDALQQHRADVLGVPTGFRPLDAALGGGLQRADLTILAARPGSGKTSLAMNIASHVALHLQGHVAIFSLEMSARQLGLRLLSMEANVDQRMLRLGQIEDWDQVLRAADTLSEGAMWIDETPALSLAALRSKARRLMATHHLDLLIVDYLQLLHFTLPDGKRCPIREQEIAEIGQGLKALAGELHIPVLALAQLNRALENRQNKRPQLSDLRESGALENEADVVLFIYREDLYQQRENPATRNMADLIIAKQRNGPVGEIRVRFCPERTSFHDLE